MSTIDKLLIRGIRSFGVENGDEQGIVFNSPLSLIVGQNGCGKTTIIECLKYALTGDLPPGSDKGKSFIHDPKMSNYAECIAQVKLQIRNYAGKKVTVTRSMKTSMKRGKLSFETMDASVSVEENGKQVALSKRCIDVNSQMATEMGVSRAIMNNVIFCHQEDSSWPLDEQKKLKEKFDAIFGTTEYNKAIDKLMGIKKSYAEKKSIKERDLREFSVNKADADKRARDLEDAETKLQKLNEMYSSFDEELLPIKEQLEEIRKIEIDVSKWVEERTKLKTKLENCKEQQENLRAKIKKLQEGKSVDDLEFEIQCFNESFLVKQNNLRDMECELKGELEKEKQLQSIVNDLKSRGGTLVYKRQQEQELLSVRAKRIQKLCLALEITVASELENKSVDMEPIFEQILITIADKEDSIRNIAQKHEEIDEDFQKRIDLHRVNIAAIEADMVAKRDQNNRLKQEERKLSKEVDDIESSAMLLKSLSKELGQVEDNFKSFTQTTDLDSMQKVCEEKKMLKSQLESQMEKLDDDIHFLTSIASVTSAINMKQIQKEERQAEVERLKNKHSSSLIKILGATSFKNVHLNYRRTVLPKQDELKFEKRSLADDLKKKQMKFAALQNSRKIQADSLKQIKLDISSLEEKVYDVCGSEEYEDVLAKHKETIDKSQLELSAARSSEALYTKFIDDLKGHPGCPLCHTKLSTGDQSKLSMELQDEISGLPSKISKLDLMWKNEQRNYDRIINLGVSVDRLKKLKDDVDGEQSKLKTLDHDLKGIQIEIDLLDEKVREVDNKLELISSLIGDMQVLDDGIAATEKLSKDLEGLNLKLPESIPELDLDDAQIQKSTLLSEIKIYRSEIDTLEKELTISRKRYNDFCEKINKLKAEKLKLQEGVQALSQIKDRLQDIKSQITVIVQELAANETSLVPEKASLDRVTTEKARIKSTNRGELDEARRKLGCLKDLHLEIQNDSAILQQFAEENLENAIKRMEEQLEGVNQNLTIKRKNMHEIGKKIDDARLEMSDQALLDRDLKDNLELLVKVGEEKELQAKFSSLRKTIDGADYQRVDREKKELIRRQDLITAKRGEVTGQQSELRVQVKRVQKELLEPRYKDAMRNYRTCFYEGEVLKQAISDLNQYRQALEWALLKFHSEKMEKINELIREFWRDIYRGNDIDYIQIRTDEQGCNDNKRRSYNYRVVQCKNGTEIDMRGRCSAGQRVLACIIIRMALAETFSSNCGVLALDEPTTNLDKENIESLCMALRKIVDARKTQSNFMLLIITHDEDFTKSLGNIDVFYRVARDVRGKSRITKYKAGEA